MMGLQSCSIGPIDSDTSIGDTAVPRPVLGPSEICELGGDGDFSPCMPASSCVGI